MGQTPTSEHLAFAQELAHESGKLIMRYFGQSLEVYRKADDTPVTVADREAEALMRSALAGRFPEHQVLGEEGGLSGPEGAIHRWVLDPIDGTKSFIHGVPLFGTLIALLHQGHPVLGVIHLPATGELCVGARGETTRVNGTPVQVTRTENLAHATMLVTSTSDLFRRGYGDALQRLQERVELVRTWGDCYGHFLVAAGRADIMFDPILSPWDVAALRPCVEGAGGRLTDRAGRTPALGESALSTNGVLHEQVLGLLRGSG